MKRLVILQKHVKRVIQTVEDGKSKMSSIVIGIEKIILRKKLYQENTTVFLEHVTEMI